MNKLLEPCIELAQSAGDAIMAIYKKDDIGQQEKSPIVSSENLN